MDEFLKLKWRIKDISELESQDCFITDDVVSNSYVYRQFKEDCKSKKSAIIPKRAAVKVIPGPQLFSPYGHFSCLSKYQHEICLKAMKLSQSGKHPLDYTEKEKMCIRTFNELHSKIIEENRKYLQIISTEEWPKNLNHALRMRPTIFTYAKCHFEKKFKKFLDYPQFYEQIDLLNMVYDENEAEVDVKCVENALEVGTLARFAPPNLKARCVFKVASLPNQATRITLNSKMPVSEDKNIEKLLENHNFDFAISLASLKKLLDASSVKSAWSMPMVVKYFKIKSGDGYVMKKVVFIDKPLPKQQPDILDFSYFAHKLFIKTTFCQYEAFRYPNEDLIVEEKVPDTSELLKKIEELEGKYKMESDVDEEPETEPEYEETHTKPSNHIYHNASYRIWKIKKKNLLNTLAKHKSEDVEISLLVRCKLDGCEKTEQGILQPVIVRPKIELQLRYGASIPTKVELSREWISLFFKPFSNLYRVRIHNSKSEVASIDKCCMQKINSEAMTLYDYKPVRSLGILQHMLEKLTKLPSKGYYLLKHLAKDGTFVTVFKECDENKSNNIYDLHKEVSNCGVKFSPSNYTPPIIDVNYILPAHERGNQMPGMFRPNLFKYKCNQSNKSMKNSKNKKKNKNKAAKAKQKDSLEASKEEMDTG